MIEVEELRERLQPYNLTKVAKESGVDRSTIYRLMHEHSRPSYDTVKKLSEWLDGKPEASDDADA